MTTPHTPSSRDPGRDDGTDADAPLDAAPPPDGAAALDAILPEVYTELRALAARHLARERRAHSLQPTALAHEVFLRLREQQSSTTSDRHRLLATAALTVRRVLVDHARRRAAQKRGSQLLRVELTEPLAPEHSQVDLLDLDDALAQLARLSPRQARVVELRWFGGLTGAEIASTLGVSPRTVAGDWRVARSWLSARLDPR